MCDELGCCASTVILAFGICLGWEALRVCSNLAICLAIAYAGMDIESVCAAFLHSLKVICIRAL